MFAGAQARGVPPKRGVEHAIQLKPGTRPPPATLAAPPERAGRCGAMHAHLDAGAQGGHHAEVDVAVRQHDVRGAEEGRHAAHRDRLPRAQRDDGEEQYPLPLMDELFDRVAGAKFFTSIDLRNGFHQIALRPEDREKTAFRTRFGSFEYTVLPMGLCNAPGTFMQLMNTASADMLDKSVLCFLDDILIFSQDRGGARAAPARGAAAAAGAQAVRQDEKCEFMQREVAFLGHRIGADGLRVAPDKVSAVQQWPQPQHRHRGALLPRAGQLLPPLRAGLQPHRAAADGADEGGHGRRLHVGRRAAGSVRRAQGCAVLAACAARAGPVQAVRAELRRVQVRHRCHAAAGPRQRPAAGRLLQRRNERRGAQLRRARAGVHGAAASACQHWRHYLHGTQPFTLLSDHDSLKYHKSMPNLSGRLARWIEKMAEFDYMLQHIPGKDNVVADALSRRADLAAMSSRAGSVPASLRSILKKSVTFTDDNPFACWLQRAHDGHPSHRSR